MAYEPTLSDKGHKDRSYTVKERKSGKDIRSALGLCYSEGCCQGQTGHHLVPDSWAETANCKDYVEGRAPVVCVEGVSQNDGTHQSIHFNLNKELEKQGGTDDYTTSQVIDMATESHAKTFPNSGDCTFCILSHPCDKDCIKAQLAEYYDCGTFSAEPIPMKVDDVTTPTVTR